MIREHTRLRAFVIADETAIHIYKLTKSFPKEELYGITSQMRRAAVSVASNIVDGCARSSKPEFIRFLVIAYGSARELRYQFSLAKRLGYVQTEDSDVCENKLEESEKVLASLIRSQRKTIIETPKPLEPSTPIT